MKKGKYWVNGEVRWVSENGGRVSIKRVSKDVVSEKKVKWMMISGTQKISSGLLKAIWSCGT